MNRRDFLRGVIVLAPAVILTPGLLMRVKPIVVPSEEEIVRLLTETNDILSDMPFRQTELQLWLEESERRIVQAMAVDLNLMLTAPERKWFSLEANKDYLAEKRLLLGQ